MLRAASESDKLSSKDQFSDLKKKKKIRNTSEKKSKKRKQYKSCHRRKEKSCKDLNKTESNMLLLGCENNLNNEVKSSQASYGPEVPPNLKQNKGTFSTVIPVQARKPSSELFIGPIMPHFLSKGNDVATSAMNCVEKPENLIDYFGPLSVAENEKSNATQVQLEQRALQLKMATIDGCLLSCSNNYKAREEWMTKLPEVGIKSGLEALSRNKRSFCQGRSVSDLSARTCWTKTPNDNVQKKKTEGANEDQSQKNAQEIDDKDVDAEQRALAEKYIFGKSLLEMHHKKLRKELQCKSKEIKTLNEKPTRRPFTRDVDFKLNKIESNQTRSIIAQSKMLNTKFACGKRQYL